MFFREFGLNVEDYQTNQFIVTFPNTQLDVIFKKVAICPTGYWGSKPLVPGFLRTAMSIHIANGPVTSRRPGDSRRLRSHISQPKPAQVLPQEYIEFIDADNDERNRLISYDFDETPLFRSRSL
jgi:hypothetical protein